MFAGHYGVGLVLKCTEKKLSLGWIFLAVMLPDILLGIFVLFGLEKVIIPENYTQIHYLLFHFPLSHGFASTILLAALIMVFAKVFWPVKTTNKTRIAVVLAIAFASHFLLDTLVHIPEIPILGNNSYKIGLGLWRDFTVGLITEICIALAGLVIYLLRNKEARSRTKIGVAIIIVIISLLTSSQIFSPMPDESMVKYIAIQWIVSGIGLSLLAFWLDKSGGIHKVNNQSSSGMQNIK